jgi:hypothetical protein
MRTFFVLLLVLWVCFGSGQTRREDIHTDFVLYNRRMALEKDLRERMIGRHFSLPLDSNSEDGYLSGCWAVEQFLFDGPDVRQGFDHLFGGYAGLGYDTRRAFLEAVYAVEPDRYRREEAAILNGEGDPRLFALCAVYLYRADSSAGAADDLKIKLVERFPGYDTVAVLRELMGWLGYHPPGRPDMKELFVWDRGFKTIYSFQRRDRDYPGLAVVQHADGRFVRDEAGRLQVFEQLGRVPACRIFSRMAIRRRVFIVYRERIFRKRILSVLRRIYNCCYQVRGIGEGIFTIRQWAVIR